MDTFKVERKYFQQTKVNQRDIFHKIRYATRCTLSDSHESHPYPILKRLSSTTLHLQAKSQIPNNTTCRLFIASSIAFMRIVPSLQLYLHFRNTHLQQKDIFIFTKNFIVCFQSSETVYRLRSDNHSF